MTLRVLPDDASRPRVRPYPLSSLPRLARAQVDAGRRLLSHLPLEAGPEWDAACAALGGPVELALAEAYALPARELVAHARGAALLIAGPHERKALLVIDPLLATRLARTYDHHVLHLSRTL